ncbi:MATE family efflux transporter [Salisaeta longa]|uniref:MATE family efflux transporter n=1 Tax=Salisaeta longa TaxID=503170 RepID=UPI0003B655F2|nr:MATE family efflux transporter [Salisaeta longa]
MNRDALRAELAAMGRLAAPVTAAQVGQVSMGFIDTVMVGQLGPTALAGVALGNTLFFFVLIVTTGVIQGVNPMVSQAVGRRDHAAVTRSVRQGLWLAVGLGVPAVALLWFAEPALHGMGQAPAAVAQATGYLHAIVWGLPAALGYQALRSFAEGLARPVPVTVITYGGVALNIAANYALMFGAGPLPALGLVGTGWATTLVFWFMFALLAGLTYAGRPFRMYPLWHRLRTPDLRMLRALVYVGGPMGVSRGIEAGLFTLTALMAGTLGTTALAAHQIALQTVAFVFMVPVGLSIAGSVRVGQAAGRGDAAGVRRAGWLAMALAGSAMGISAVVFWTWPAAIVRVYLAAEGTHTAAVAQAAAHLLGIAAFFQVVDGLQVAAHGALQGLKDTRVPMLIALCTYWGIGLSSGYVAGLQWGYGVYGLWWGLVVGLAAAAVALIARFRQQVHRLPAAATRT